MLGQQWAIRRGRWATRARASCWSDPDYTVDDCRIGIYSQYFSIPNSLTLATSVSKSTDLGKGSRSAAGSIDLTLSVKSFARRACCAPTPSTRISWKRSSTHRAGLESLSDLCREGTFRPAASCNVVISGFSH